MEIKKYIVKALSVGGRKNAIYKSGDLVTELNFQPGRAVQLARSGYLEPIEQPLEDPVIGVLIITRGDRPAFLNHAKFLLSRQTRTPDHIEIMDDKPLSDDIDITYRYRIGCERLFKKGCDGIIFWEDDDWYRHDYVEKMEKAWKSYKRPAIFGINTSIYYHIESNKYIRLSHKGRASMMSTMISKNAKINWGDDSYPYTDIVLWKQLTGVSTSFSEVIAIGIKHGTGLCGGGGHVSDWSHYNKIDNNKEFLKSIVDPQSFAFYSNSISRYEIKQYSENPFLTIVTRRYKRPIGFKKNQESIEALKDKDIEQIFINDPVGYGMLAANKSFEEVKDLVSGEYVFLLDDDDFIVNENMVSELKEISKDKPDVIFFRMIIKNGMNNNFYPTDHVWKKAPRIAHIGGSCWVVSKETYKKYIHHFGLIRCGDFNFINEVWKDNPKVHWHDVIMCETGKVSRGQAEQAV